MAKTYCNEFIEDLMNVNTSDLVQDFDCDRMYNGELTFGDVLPTPHIDLTVEEPVKLPQTPLDFQDDYDFHDTLKCFEPGYKQFDGQDATNHGILPTKSNQESLKRSFSKISTETPDVTVLPSGEPAEKFVDLSQLRGECREFVGADLSPEPVKSPDHRRTPDSLTSNQAMEEWADGVDWDEEIEVCGSLVDKPANKSYGENRIKYLYLKEQESVTDFSKPYAKEAFALFTHLVIERGI